MTKPDQNDVQTSSAGIQRRTVVRAGAHAAWAVPAITLATAAPAMAASLAANAIAALVAATRTGTSLALTGGSISNVGTQATQNLTVTVTVTPTGPGVDFRNSTITTPTGFSLTSTTVDNSSKSTIFVFTATSQIAPGGSTAFNPTVTLAQAGAGSITITPNVTNGSETGVTRSFT